MSIYWRARDGGHAWRCMETHDAQTHNTHFLKFNFQDLYGNGMK